MSFSEWKAVPGKAVHRAARTMCWLVAFAAMALTACDGAHTYQIAERKPQVDPDWWLGPLSDAHDHLIDAAFKACPPQGLLSNERCVAAKIVESFAAQSSAGAHCPMEKPGLLLCVDLFTATERIYRVLGRDPQGAIDWGDPYESLTNLEDQLTVRLTEKCPGMERDKCVAEEMAAILPISANDASRCVLTPDVSRSVRCVTGVIRIEGYQDALRNIR